MVGVGLLRTELGFGNLGFTGRLGLGLSTMGAMMFRTDYMIPLTFTVTCSTSVFTFSVLHFSVVGSVR